MSELIKAIEEWQKDCRPMTAEEREMTNKFFWSHFKVDLALQSENTKLKEQLKGQKEAFDAQCELTFKEQDMNAKLLEEMKNLNQDKQTLMTHCDSLRTENLRLKEMLERMAEALEDVIDIDFKEKEDLYWKTLEEIRAWKENK